MSKTNAALTLSSTESDYMEVVIPQSPKLHDVYFTFLYAAKEAATAYGNTVSIIEPFPCPAVDEFRKHYVHHSPNPAWFEQWCFEQWLLIADWMEQNNRDVVFKIDSDCLVFANMQNLWESIGRPRFSLPLNQSFVTKAAAREYSDYILKRFGNEKELEQNLPKPFLSDMYLLEEYLKQQGAVDLSNWRNLDSIIDVHLLSLLDGPGVFSQKDIWFVNGQPCCVRANGYTRMLTLHCWGTAKDKMGAIWDQSRRSLGTSPTRLSEIFSVSRTD